MEAVNAADSSSLCFIKKPRGGLDLCALRFRDATPTRRASRLRGGVYAARALSATACCAKNSAPVFAVDNIQRLATKARPCLVGAGRRAVLTPALTPARRRNSAAPSPLQGLYEELHNYYKRPGR